MNDQPQGLGADPISKVRYSFGCFDGADAQWHVRALHFSEGLSEPYELVLDLITEDVNTDTNQVLGAACELTIDREKVARSVYGIVHRVDYLGISADKLTIRAHVGPALRLLSQSIDTRFFQEMPVPDILREVLEAALGANRRTVRFDVQRNYDTRDYCVQYKESDLDFVMRLMQEEGIAFYFDHVSEDDHEVLVLVDAGDQYPEIETVTGGSDVSIIPVGQDNADEESIQQLDWCRALTSTSVFQRDYDYMSPTQMLDHPIEGEDDRGLVREVYEHAERRLFYTQTADQTQSGQAIDDGKLQGTMKLETIATQQKVGRGGSNVTGFSPGYTYELTDHDHVDAAVKYVLTRVVHTGDCPEESILEAAASDSAAGNYENRFECIPFDVPYRPPRIIPKPKVYGPQTAAVTGPAGEEIHTDDKARIQVRLHWDRLSSSDATTSCWVPVAQTWAGAGWGSVWIPRIGMEVVVEFLEGNPDRPLVTGCVYNEGNGLPYPHPDEKTKSTIKSNSSIGGGGFNEFRFEDLKDSEEVFLHAQKDLNETIRNNMSTSVGNDQSLTVGNDRTRTVTGHEVVTIEKDRTTAITGSENITIDGSWNLTVKGGAAKGKAKDPGAAGTGLDITGEYNITASKKLTITVGASKVVMDTSSIAIETSAKISLKVGGSTVTLVPGDILAKHGSSALKLDGGADLKGGAKVLIHKGGSQVLLDGAAEMKGSTAKVIGKALAEIKGNPAKVTGGPVIIGGAMVDISGKSVVKING